MTNIEEVWKDIPNFEGYYQVSNLGRIKGLPRTVMCARPTSLPGRVRKPNFDAGGYGQVHLRKLGKSYYPLIHRLVANAFIPNPTNRKEVNHINGIKSDNRVVNLEWVTPRENSIKYRSSIRSLPTGVLLTASKRFIAYINVNGKQKYLGTFDTPEQARLVYREEEEIHYPETQTRK